MIQGLIRRMRAIASFVLAGGLLAVSMGSHAAVFRTRWDPIFNNDFTTAYGLNLGWEGEATITVSNGCVSPSVTVSFVPPNPCGTAALTGYTILFYNADNNSGLGGIAAAGDLSPDPTAVSFDASSIANGMNLGPIDAGTFIFSMLSGDTEFLVSLSFTIGGGPVLTLQENSDCTECTYDSSQNPPTVIWERVPEPASLALAGLALAGMALVRRRKA